MNLAMVRRGLAATAVLAAIGAPSAMACHGSYTPPPPPDTATCAGSAAHASQGAKHHRGRGARHCRPVAPPPVTPPVDPPPVDPQPGF